MTPTTDPDPQNTELVRVRGLDVIPRKARRGRAARFGAERLRTGNRAETDARALLRGVNLELRAGERLAILGPSGAGKTTLAAALIGAYPPGLDVSAVEHRFIGHDLRGRSERARRMIRREAVVFVPQDPAAAIAPTRRLGAVLDAAVPRAAQGALLAEVGLLPSAAPEAREETKPREETRPREASLPALRRHYLWELSGGQQRRFALALALHARPRLLILDEPTAGLDAGAADVIQKLLRDRLAQTGAAALVGASGSGKTTLMRAIAGLHPRRAGEVAVDGRRLAPRLEERSRAERRLVQWVPQDGSGSLNPEMPVGVALKRIAGSRGVRASAAAAAIAAVAAELGLPEDVLGRVPRELSGGQRQRVLLARALLLEPAVLLCDEVTSALDAASRELVLAVLLCRARDGAAVVVASHDEHGVVAACDTCYRVESGGLTRVERPSGAGGASAARCGRR